MKSVAFEPISSMNGAARQPHTPGLRSCLHHTLLPTKEAPAAVVVLEHCSTRTPPSNTGYPRAAVAFVTLRSRGGCSRDRSKAIVSLALAVLIAACAAAPAVPAPPPAELNIVQLAESVKDLSTLVVAVVHANLTGALSGPGPFTVMAPTNEAFAQLPPNLLAFLLAPENKADLVRVLTYHVIGSKILAADLTNGEELLTLEGGHERVTLYNGSVFINFAQVVAADNFASNGVVHIINRVLFPRA